MTPPRTVDRTCTHLGCDRYTVGNTKQEGPASRLCCIHDGLNEPLVCHCKVAHPEYPIGQCTTCWRVIVRLHPTLLDAWPELADQPLANEVAA